MKTILNTVLVLLTTLTMNLAWVENADAARVGGGSSFGSKSSQSQSIKQNTMNRDAPAPSKAQTANQDRKQQYASRGGLMGLLGGLAIGGLLGALFFGGAFENINFLDILLFGGLALAAYLFFKSRARRAPMPATAGPAGVAPEDVHGAESATVYRESQQPQGGGSAGSFASAGERSLDDLRRPIPKGFDQTAFLEGAQACFARLQRVWDEGNLSEVRRFTTDHVFAEIQSQHQAKTQPSRTEILDLRAELLNVVDLGSMMEAAVLFEAKLREDGVDTQVAEVWHFNRPKQSNQPTWFVDGIQQVER